MLFWVWCTLTFMVVSVVMIVLMAEKDDSPDDSTVMEKDNSSDAKETPTESFVPLSPPSHPSGSVTLSKEVNTQMYVLPPDLDEVAQQALLNFEFTRCNYALLAHCKPLISIVTRSYNRPHLLNRSLEMVQLLLGRAFEHIVLQDQKGMGMRVAETALYAFRERFLGQYICHLDDDDFFINFAFVEDMRSHMAQRPGMIIYQCIHETYGLLPSVWKVFPSEGQIATCNVLFRRDVYQNPQVTGVLSQKHAGDYACIHNALIYCKQNDLEVFWVPKPYIFITAHGSPLNHDNPLWRAPAVDFFVTVELMGRLGNNLFQIATAYAYAKIQQKIFVTHTPWTHPMYSWVPHHHQRCNWLTYEEPTFQYQSIPWFQRNVKLKGYFQSERYFKSFRSDLIRLFIPNDAVGPLPNRQSEIPSVSLHVRRGDYVNNPLHQTVGMDYYQTALNRLPSPLQVYVFSDDIDWCREHLPKLELPNLQWEYVDQGQDFEQLILMTQCDHHILAASSFSWWGAYLSEKVGITVAPKQWFPSDNPIKEWDSIYCENWIVI
jgi:hypothetical protein